jgi:hypothetical protein
MKIENHVHPEHRKRIAQAAKRGGTHGEFSLKPTDGARPFCIKSSISGGLVGAFVLDAIRDMEFSVVGVSNMNSYTLVHVGEA